MATVDQLTVSAKKDWPDGVRVEAVVHITPASDDSLDRLMYRVKDALVRGLMATEEPPRKEDQGYMT